MQRENSVVRLRWQEGPLAALAAISSAVARARFAAERKPPTSTLPRSYEVFERGKRIPPIGSGPWSNVGNESTPITRDEAEQIHADSLRDHDFFDDELGWR